MLKHSNFATLRTLVDLDPKTSEGLVFCSNITAPGASIFHIPSESAKKTSPTGEREKRAYTEALTEHKDQERLQKFQMSVPRRRNQIHMRMRSHSYKR